MRINIKTEGKLKDSDLKALYIIDYALKIVSARMIIPTLDFFVSRYGFKIVKK